MQLLRTQISGVKKVSYLALGKAMTSFLSECARKEFCRERALANICSDINPKHEIFGRIRFASYQYKPAARPGLRVEISNRRIRWLLIYQFMGFLRSAMFEYRVERRILSFASAR